MMPTPTPTVDEAVADLVGRPWRADFCCLAFLVVVLRRLGHEIDLPAEHRAEALPPAALERLLRRFRRLDRPVAGAAVNFHGSRHCGIVLADARRFAHCQRGQGVVISRLATYRRRLEGFYALRETVYEEASR